jgi:hypothetical protein
MIIELHAWCQKMKLEDYFHQFVKNDMYLDTIADLDENTVDSVLDAMQIDSVGVKLKIKKAIPELKGKLTHKIFIYIIFLLLIFVRTCSKFIL